MTVLSAPRNCFMAQVRMCFPAYSNPVIQDWIKRGYLSCSKVDRGTEGSIFAFNWPEVVLVGIIGNFSVFGLLKAPSRVTLYREDRQQKLVKFSLTDPSKMLDYCDEHDFDVGITIHAFQARDLYPLFRNKPRTKAAEIKFTVTFMPMTALRKDMKGWAHPDLSLTNLYGANMACINVNWIAKSVKDVLGPAV